MCRPQLFRTGCYETACQSQCWNRRCWPPGIVTGIPLAAHDDYLVNDRPALDWAVEAMGTACY